MFSYMLLDDYSVLNTCLTDKKCYTLSKNFLIEILPHSSFNYEHGFYFSSSTNLYIKLSNELNNKLSLSSTVMSLSDSELNRSSIELINTTNEIVTIQPYSPILILSNTVLCENNHVEQHCNMPQLELIDLNTFENVAEPKSEPAVEPVTESVAEPKPEPVVEPVAESVAESVTESVAELKNESVAEPKNELVAEPKTESVAEPKNELVAEPKTESVAEPKTESVAELKPVAEPKTEKRKYIRKKK